MGGDLDPSPLGTGAPGGRQGGMETTWQAGTRHQCDDQLGRLRSVVCVFHLYRIRARAWLFQVFGLYPAQLWWGFPCCRPSPCYVWVSHQQYHSLLPIVEETVNTSSL